MEGLEKQIEEETKVLFIEHSDSTFEFALNDNKKLNVLDLSKIELMLAKLKEFDQAEKNGEKVPHVLFMSGTGDKAFCAGGDI